MVTRSHRYNMLIDIIILKVFECGFYPEKWCDGLVNPLHKQGEIDKAVNYRKITVASALGKIFDSILNRRLRFAKRCLNIDDPYQ